MSLEKDYKKLTNSPNPPERAFFKLKDVEETLQLLKQAEKDKEIPVRVKNALKKVNKIRELHAPYARIVHVNNISRIEKTCMICQTPFPCQTRQITK